MAFFRHRSFWLILATVLTVWLPGNRIYAQPADIVTSDQAAGEPTNGVLVSDQSEESTPPDANQTEPDEQTPVAPPPPVVRPEYDSPRSTMFSFLSAMDEFTAAESDDERAKAIEKAVECFQLPEDESLDRAPEDLAKELLLILNRLCKVTKPQLLNAHRIGELDSFQYYPVDLSVDMYLKHGFEDQSFIQTGDIYYYPAFARVYPEGVITLITLADGPHAGEWRFSEETISGIRDFYRSTADLPIRTAEGVSERELSPSLWLRSQMPALLREGEWIGLEYWQWAALLIIVFAGIVLDFVLRMILAGIATVFMKRRSLEATTETKRRMVRPFGLFAAGLLWLWVVRYLDLPTTALNILLIAIRLIVMVAGVWAASRVVDLVCEALSIKAQQTATKFDDLLIPLLRKTIKVFIAVFGLIYIADAFSIQILPLLTGLGIGGAAIAFASKDTIENFFGSVAVIVDRPFEVGDWVVINDVEGTVETLGFRSTRVRTFYNSLVAIPNANLVRATVDNYGQRRYRRYKTHVGIAYDTPPDLIEAFCEGIKEIIRIHPYTRKDYYQVWLNQFAASSLDVLIYIFHEAPDWTTELRERQRFMLDTIRLAERLGIEFAFPTQTLYLRNDQAPEHAPTEPMSPTCDTKAQRRGRAAVHAVTNKAPWRDEKPEPVVFTQCAFHPEDDEDSQIESTTGGDG